MAAGHGSRIAPVARSLQNLGGFLVALLAVKSPRRREKVVDEEVEVQWLQIPRLLVLIASENVAVMLASVSTPVVPLAGTVLETVGAGRAAQAAFSGVGFPKWQGPLRHQWPLPSPFVDMKAKLPGELSRLRRGYHEGNTAPANHDERAHQPVHHPHPYRPSERLQVVVDAHLIYKVVPRHTHGQKPEQAHLKPNIGQVVGDHIAHPELVEKQECREGDDELVAQARYLQRRTSPPTIPYSPNLMEA